MSHVSSGRVYISSDVIFDENTFPFSNDTPKQTPDQLLDRILMFSPEAIQRTDLHNQHAEISTTSPVRSNPILQQNPASLHLQEELAVENSDSVDPDPAAVPAGADMGEDSPAAAAAADRPGSPQRFGLS